MSTMIHCTVGILTSHLDKTSQSLVTETITSEAAQSVLAPADNENKDNEVVEEDGCSLENGNSYCNVMYLVIVNAYIIEIGSKLNMTIRNSKIISLTVVFIISLI